MTLALKYTARSDRGLVRQNNEDAAYAGPRLLALADGMGGHAAGEVASQITISSLAQLDEDQPGSDLTGALAAVMVQANDLIASHIEAHPETDGMGCTVTALLFDGRRAGLLHVGDSRAYLLRDGSLSQITRDDTYVQSLVDEGSLSADEAHSHPRRSLILKALTGEPVEPTTVTREARVGDRYLLCSDGLSDPVSFDTIAETLTTGSCDDAADRLVALALRSGGPDNITVVVADVVASAGNALYDPIVVGSASTDEPEESRSGSDTAAGRAAAFSRAQQDQSVERARPETIEATEDSSAAPRSGSRRRFALSVAAAVVLLIAVAGLSAILVRSNYFVSAADAQVVVKRGITGEVLGFSLSRVDQVACLSRDGELTMHTTDDIPPGCNVLTLGDLQEPAREGVRAGLPSGSREEASEQITRLAAENLLPPCDSAPETRSPSTPTGSAQAPATSSAARTPAPRGTSGSTPSSNADEPATSSPDAPIPGQDCRAVN